MSSKGFPTRTTAPSFYVTGGTLRQDAPSYVERRADKDLYEGLLRGEFPGLLIQAIAVFSDPRGIGIDHCCLPVCYFGRLALGAVARKCNRRHHHR